MADAMIGEPDGGGDGDGPNQPLPSAAERADGGDCRGAAVRSCEQWRHLERGAASGPAGRRAAAAALSANEAQGGRSSTSTAAPDHRRRLRRARQLRAGPALIPASDAAQAAVRGAFVERQITKSPTGSVFCLSAVGSQPERYTVNASRILLRALAATTCTTTVTGQNSLQ